MWSCVMWSKRKPCCDLCRSGVDSDSFVRYDVVWLEIILCSEPNRVMGL